MAARDDGELPAGEGEGSPLNLANALTASRLVLAPVFLVLYVQGDRLRALAAFAAAAATDVLDGLVARALRQHTRLGAALDPVADKFLAACALVALAVTGRLPAWLPALVVARDAVQVAGAAWLRATGRAFTVAPTRIGKYAMFAVAATVVLALAGDAGVATGPWVEAMALLGAQCLLVSFVQYALSFARALRAPPGGGAGPSDAIRADGR